MVLLFQNWPQNWLYSRHGSEIASEVGLDWLLTLWAYRDAEVKICYCLTVITQIPNIITIIFL